jgi:hypothetical protein
MTETKAEKLATLAGEVFGTLLVGAAYTALKAWLLVLVLGWFGVTVLTFWKAVVVILLLNLLFATIKNKK